MITSLPQFDPPYDSPIQHWLAWVLSKYVVPGAKFVKEKEVVTKVSRFRVDLVIELSEQKSIGIECDGVEFHDPLADLFRDALILGNSRLSAIYRFPGKVLSSHPEDALYLLSLWEPDFFNERITVQRNMLASDDVKAAFENEPWDDRYPYLFEWHYKTDGGQLSLCQVVRHRFGLRNSPPDSIDRIWEFSRTGSYCSITNLAEAFAAQHPTHEWRGWCYYCLRESQLFSILDAKHYKNESQSCEENQNGAAQNNLD